MLFALFACSGGADLSVGSWQVSPLFGDGIADHVPGCTLAFTIEGLGADPQEEPVMHALVWDESCGRSDLPDQAGYTARYPGVGRRYVVAGGEGTDAQWLTREGDHPDLFELWVYDPDDDIGPANYDTEQVAALW